MQSEPRAARDGLWLYFALTFALSWAAWLLIPLLGLTALTFPGVLLFMVGGFGPSIIGVIQHYRLTTKAARGDFWKRVWDARRVRPLWYALILIGFPALAALAIWLDGVINGGAAGMEALLQAAAQPASLIGLVLVGILFGPLAEELGWRGFALDRMIARWGLPRSSLILGVVWWAWHLPLFLIPDTTHYKWGLWSAPFWAFLPTVIGLSVVIAWAYAANRRSIFAAILVHFIYNFILSLVYPVTGGMLLIYAALLAVWVTVLLTRRVEGLPARTPA